MKYEVNYHDGFFDVKTYGDAELKVFFDFIKELIEHKKWKPGSRVLLDHSEIDASNTTAADIKVLSERLISMKNKIKNVKIAIVAPNDLQFGMARMTNAYTSGNWSANEGIFRSRDEAIAWLNKS